MSANHLVLISPRRFGKSSVVAKAVRESKRKHITVNLQQTTSVPDLSVKLLMEFSKFLYCPKTSVEDIDGKKVFVIWCPAGLYRPYEVPDDVTAKEKKYNYRVRYNSSSIVPKGEMKLELLELASNVPFDDRPNMEATISDVSKTLVRDFLVKTGSKLAQQVETEPFENVLQGMELLAGPKEAVYPKNVALMMFNDHPEKFFPCTQVDIVMFPGGKVKDPNNFIEVPPIMGPIDSIFDKTMIS